MSIIQSLAFLAALQLTSAVPLTTAVEKRQDPYNAGACIDNGCTDCPFTIGSGSGFPQCIIYTLDDLADLGWVPDDVGTTTVYFDIPELDPTCKFIILTPVADEGCGGNALVANGATCAPVVIDQTVSAQFCCGTGDCSAAGAPGKRALTSPANTLIVPEVTYLAFHDSDGQAITSSYIKRAEPEVAAPAKSAARNIFKRDCESFTITNGPYTKSGQTVAISDQVSCGPTQPCSATEAETVETTFGLSVSVSVGDPLGIVSASVGVDISMSMSREFSAEFMFGPGETGYVAFVPILTCVDGTFDGDCEGGGQANTACWPTEDGNGETYGQIRGVLVRA